MEELDFMCKCSPEGEKTCEDLLAWAIADLNCKPEQFMTGIVYGLQWSLKNEWYGEITGFGCDMWAVVHAELGKYGSQDKLEAYAYCDIIEHGLARIWKWAREVSNEGTAGQES